MKSLKYFRIILAVLVFTAISLVFLDTSGWIQSNFNFLTKIQLVPAFLALNFIAIIFLALITLIFGRIYCSVICPLGILQDFILRIRKVFAKSSKRKIGLFKFKKANTAIRITFFSLFIIILLLGCLNVMAISLGSFIEPYSEFGRIITSFGAPVYDSINNYLAGLSAANESYAILPIHRVFSAALFIVASITFIIICIFVWVGGREYCNTICPVGTLLGYASKFSFLKIRINKNKCKKCGACQRHCKAQCIDSKNHLIDTTRCVNCFDCLNSCKQNAISYSICDKTHKEKTAGTNDSRRTALATMATLGGVFMTQAVSNVVEKVTDGGLTPLKDRPSTIRKRKLVPPGAISQDHINSHCVGCQLCIQSCPEGVLSMSTDIETFMQPVMNYDSTYCVPQCHKCSEVCPAGVFINLDEPQKCSLKIGSAVVNLKDCISATGTDSCGNCSRHCPAGAIEMVEQEDCVIPVVNDNMCIGCGACEVHCPVGTIASMKSDQAAIHVEGIDTQRFI